MDTGRIKDAIRIAILFLVPVLTPLVPVLTACRSGQDGAPPAEVEEAQSSALPPDLSPAAAAHQEGLDAFARWDADALFRHMLDAWHIEPGYVPALLDLSAYYTQAVYLPTDVRVALDSLVTRDPEGSGLCATFILLRSPPLYSPELPAAARAADLDAHPCAVYARIQVPEGTEPEERVRLAEALWRRYPDSPHLAQELLTLLGEARAPERLLRVADEMTLPERHPLVRALGYVWRVNALAALDRWEEAMAAKSTGNAFVREAEPGIQAAYLLGFRGMSPTMKLRRSDPHWADVQAILEETESALVALSKRGDVYVGGRIRAGEATRLLDSGFLTESLELWDRTVEVADTFVPDYRAIIYLRRGRTLSKLGDFPAAEIDLLKARDLAAQAGDDEQALEVEHNLLHVYEAMGLDGPAREAGEAFVEITARRPIKPVRMMAYHDLGTFLQRRGDHGAAARMFDAMLATIDTLDDYHYWAGEYYEMIGDLDRATALYRRSWLENQHDARRALVALARLAEATGEAEVAREYAQAHDTGPWTSYPEFRPILPGVLARGGEEDAAVRSLMEARERARANGQVAAWGSLTLESADLEMDREAFGRARALADSAVTAAESVADAPVAIQGRGLSALARVLQGGADREEALADLQGAVEDADLSRHRPHRTELLRMLGDALSAMGRTEASLVAYARADALSDSLALSLAHDLVRADYRAEQLRISNHALRAILNAGPHADAPLWFAAWSLRRKGRGILEAAGSGLRIPPPDLPSVGGSSSSWENARETLRRVRSALADDEALLDYVVLDRAVAVLVLTRDDARLVHLPIEAPTLRSQVRTLLARLQPVVGRFVDLSRAYLDPGLARSLYRDLVSPLEPVLGDRNHLALVPDAPLHLLPFDALIRSDGGVVPEYFLDRYTLTTVPSLECVPSGDFHLPQGPVVAVAPLGAGELAADENEVDAIARAFSSRNVVRLVDTAATEEAVREHAAAAAILHFATHAHPSATDPEFAHLILSGDDQDDGLLHAYEIRELRLPGSMVILSACESATGRLVRGEGPLSLSRSFLQAGARDVVGTLWPVGSSAGTLMEMFYRSLAQGSAPADALRTAKLFLKRIHPEPLYWAPFVLVSRGSGI